MSTEDELRSEIIKGLTKAWRATPELSFGRLLLEVLQPEKPIGDLKKLDDGWLLVLLDSYCSVQRQRK